MALVHLENDDNEPWLSEHDSCERLYREIVEQLNARNAYPKSSENYASLSARGQIRLKQYSSEVGQLKKKLNEIHGLTFEEKERRLRLIENLQSKNIYLNQRLNERVGSGHERNQLIGAGPSNWPLDDEDVSRPLLTDTRELTIEELRERQQRIISEQDKGLENLSGIIKRQKDIAVTINNEVDLHNDLVDDISDRMDRTNTGIQRETVQIKVIGTKDNTCGYWIVIILLFAAIVTIALVF